MDLFDYAALRDEDVTPLIAEFGVAATLTRWSKGTYSAAAGTFGAGSTGDVAVTVVISDFDEREIDGTQIKRDDKRVIMSGADEAPTMNDKLKVAGIEYEIVAVKTTRPGDVDVVYEIQARK